MLMINGINSGLLPIERLGKIIPAKAVPTISGAGGDRYEIGLLTEWEAALLGGQTDAYKSVIAQADYDHDWTKTYPVEHHPGLYWLAYCLTRQEKYIAKMRAKHRHFRTKIWPPYDETKGSNYGTVRARAWAMRDLFRLAAVDDFYKPALDDYRRIYEDLAFKNTTPRRTLLKHTAPEIEPSQKFSNPDAWQISVWMQDGFWLQVLAHGVLLGHDQWRRLLEREFSFIQDLFDNARRYVTHYGPMVVWVKGQPLETFDAIIAYNDQKFGLSGYGPKDIYLKSGTDDFRGRHVLAALALSAAANVPGARELWADWKSTLDTHSGEKWIMYRNAMVPPKS